MTSSWKTAKYRQCEQLLIAAGVTDDLGEWIDNLAGVNNHWSWTAISRRLRNMGVSVGHATIANWHAAWLANRETVNP